MTHTVCARCRRHWIFDDRTICKNCINQIDGILEIQGIAKRDGDIELISGDIADIMIQKQIVLDDYRIKQVCDIYYKSGEPSSERLTNADNLFLQLHHTNGMVHQ